MKNTKLRKLKISQLEDRILKTSIEWSEAKTIRIRRHYALLVSDYLRLYQKIAGHKYKIR